MKNKGFAARTSSTATEKLANHCPFSGHSFLLAHDQHPSHKEGSMISRYLPGALIVVLGLAFASPAEAQMGRIIESVGYSGSIWFQIAWAAAALSVLTIIVIHELSAILALCPFAAQANDAAAGFAPSARYGFAERLCKSNQKDVSCENSGF